MHGSFGSISFGSLPPPASAHGRRTAHRPRRRIALDSIRLFDHKMNVHNDCLWMTIRWEKRCRPAAEEWGKGSRQWRDRRDASRVSRLLFSPSELNPRQLAQIGGRHRLWAAPDEKEQCL